MDHIEQNSTNARISVDLLFRFGVIRCFPGVFSDPKENHQHFEADTSNKNDDKEYDRRDDDTTKSPPETVRKPSQDGSDHRKPSDDESKHIEHAYQVDADEFCKRKVKNGAKWGFTAWVIHIVWLLSSFDERGNQGNWPR